MASDRQQFERAIDNWENLHDQHAYSMPAELGRTAIICSYYKLGHDEESKNSKQNLKDIKIFRKEAMKYGDMIIENGGEVEVILNAQPQDVAEVVKDPYISHIITIGNGTLSTFFIDQSSVDGQIDWRYIAAKADHLKTGNFIQRHCGAYSRNLSVPLGAFAVYDHRNVYAPVGTGFYARGLNHPHNDYIRPVAGWPRLDYHYIKDNFRYPLAQAMTEMVISPNHPVFAEAENV